MRSLSAPLIIALALASNQPAAARQPEGAASLRAERMTAAFIAWAQANAVEQGAIAVTYHDEVIGGGGFGGRGIDDPAPVASLSKAITALCISRLIDGGRLRYDTRVPEALSGLIARTAPPTDRRLGAVTISQLLTHRSGIPRMLPQARTPGDRAEGMHSSLEEQARRILAAPLRFAPGARYEYSNQAYVLLSYIVEAITGEDYEGHCRRSVLEPIGVRTARLDPRFPDVPRAGAGGWVAGAADYARFAASLRPDDPRYGPKTREWLAARRADKPAYGLGFEYRGRGARPRLSHNGLLEEPEVSVSSQFVAWPSGLTMALNVTPARPRALDTLLAAIDRIAAE